MTLCPPSIRCLAALVLVLWSLGAVPILALPFDGGSCSCESCPLGGGPSCCCRNYPVWPNADGSPGKNAALSLPNLKDGSPGCHGPAIFSAPDDRVHEAGVSTAQTCYPAAPLAEIDRRPASWCAPRIFAALPRPPPVLA